MFSTFNQNEILKSLIFPKIFYTWNILYFSNRELYKGGRRTTYPTKYFPRLYMTLVLSKHWKCQKNQLGPRLKIHWIFLPLHPDTPTEVKALHKLTTYKGIDFKTRQAEVQELMNQAVLPFRTTC